MKVPIQNTKNGELVRHWLASGVLESDGAMHEDGLAMKLYRTCLDILQEICQQRASLNERRPLRGPTELLREELGKLYLWGESFTPGQLDKILNHAEDLRTVVIKALQQIGELLLYAVKPQQTRSVGSNNLQSQVQNLTAFIDQARSIVSQMSDESFQKNDCSDSEPSSDEDNVLKSDGLEGLARRIQIQTSHLVRLGPTIQKTLTCTEKAEAQSPFPPVVPFKVSDPADFYVSSIRDKFKQAEDHLVARLGEANWQRHHHVRHIASRDGGLLNEQLDYAENATAFFRPYSAFHDSGIGTSIPDQTEYAASHTSFLSSKSETKLDGLRVPQSPQQIIESKPFRCFLCGRTQLNIRNRVDWKMHVFADLKPYICTFSDCKVELAQFSSRAAWAEHEFSQHRITCSWRCADCLNEYPTPLLYSEHLHKMHQRKYSNIGLQMAVDMALDRQENLAEKEECPLCRLVPGRSRRAFVKHVGRHMEQIALMALPRDTEESETNDSDATDDSKEGKLYMASRGASRESKLDMSHSDDMGKFSKNRTLPPAWLIQAVKKLQESYPKIAIEAGTRASQDHEPRIRCLDCPGKLYTPGPGKTIRNFEVHLKNRHHLVRVEERLREGAENWSSHPKNEDQPGAKPHTQDRTAPKAGILQPDSGGTNKSTDAHIIRDDAYGADANGSSSIDSAAGPCGIDRVPGPCSPPPSPPPPYSIQMENGKRKEKAAPLKRCLSCNRGETPVWRRGPDGARTICNACGLHYAKLTRKMGYKASNGASNLRPREISPLPAMQDPKKQLEVFSEYDSGNLLNLVNEKPNEERQKLPWPSDLTQSTESKSTSFLSEFDQRKGADTISHKERTDWPLEMGEAGLVQDFYRQEEVSSNSHSKPSDENFVTPSRTKKLEPHSKSRAITPWTPAEEQRLREMRDAGKTWGEIAKTFSHRAEGSVKKHWYKDMHYAGFEGDNEHGPDTRRAIKEKQERNER